MALLGTLAEFQVDDILMLLSGTAKTGVLGVEGGERTGRVWVDAGRIVGAELDDHHEPADVLFELLRLADGKFAFEAGATPATPAAAEDVDAVLAHARARLAEWRDIERVIPSMASVVALRPDAADGGSLSISSDDWRTVAAIGAGGTATEIATRLGMVEFAAAKALKAVVDAGLASVAPMSAAEAGAVEASARMARATASRSTVASTDDLVRQLSSLRSR